MPATLNVTFSSKRDCAGISEGSGAAGIFLAYLGGPQM